MITRKEKEDALINRYTADIMKRLRGYEKKVRTSIESVLDAEYNLIILKKEPKPTRRSWKKDE
jgi:hypothetical protein